MTFKLPEYKAPDFHSEPLLSSPSVKTRPAPADKVAPENYHATSIYPEYYKIRGEWVLAQNSRMDCVAVIGEGVGIEIKEFRKLVQGDLVAVGRSEDGSEGIYVHENGFEKNSRVRDKFAFRTSDSRETSKALDYDRLYEILKHDREHGYIVWILGPTVCFDKDARESMTGLIEQGYVHAVLAGNALATHDLEGAIYKTALGQDIYTKECRESGHYHHLDVINQVRQAGSIGKLIEKGLVTDGIIHACIKKDIPLILAASIRDDGPLPEVIQNACSAQDQMREQLNAATTVIGLATQLHSIAVGNMTPAYRVVRNKVRPLFFYIVDMSEFVLNKLKDRGSLEITAIAANVHDFLFILKQGLLKE
jgi:lysine-ketoglutarate reductase/saccharopine dehydrogenase-like protein (TIGR00300 family)